MVETALTAGDFARLIGGSPQLAQATIDRLGLAELRFRELPVSEQARIASEVDDMIASRPLRTVGEDDPEVWERGWREVAESLKGREIAIETLRPQYFRGEPICRLEGRYVRGATPTFEYDVGLVLRRLIFASFLTGVETAVELGCGTGINLLLLAELFPNMRLIGADWAQPSCDILAQMARQTRRAIEGRIFNMLTAMGWDGVEIDSRTAVVTVHAMEQLGSQWQAFATYLRRRRPALCLHIEPLLEVYEPGSDFDDRARRYHSKRNYLAGFYPHVMELARAGQATVVAARRVRFGGLHHDAYSILAWKPGS